MVSSDDLSVERLAGGLEGFHVGDGELGVVVEHLLEVGHSQLASVL